MKVVLDVNILASAAASPAGLPAFIVDSLLNGPHRIAISDEMLVNLGKVLIRKYFSARLTEDMQAQAVARYRGIGPPVTPDPTVIGVADDEEDDRVLGTAVTAGADFVVTGDKGLLRLGAFHGIPIVTARQFLALVEL